MKNRLDRNFNPRTHRGVRRQTLLNSVKLSYFNPRTHRGVRRLMIIVFKSAFLFQSTHPSWGATKRYQMQLVMLYISIHAPIVGCDARIQSQSGIEQNFNPRTHRGVRHHCVISSICACIISIHAPIVGCDKTFWVSGDEFHQFQSTHPSWGATKIISIYAYSGAISIHAPIVGCDGGTLKLGSNLNQFQSTHPSWGATGQSKDLKHC